MLKHTKEPWLILDEGDVIEINNGTDAVASAQFDYSKDSKREQVLEDYRRICACVNACAGIETEVLETISMPHAGATLMEVTEERNNLAIFIQQVALTLKSGNYEPSMRKTIVEQCEAILSEVGVIQS